MYIDTRLEDIKQLSTPLQWNGVQVFDKMKFFKGDGPAAQFEAGHQKGGDYFCWGCGIFASQVNHVAFSLNQPYISYSARIKKVNLIILITMSKKKVQPIVAKSQTAGVQKYHWTYRGQKIIKFCENRNFK